MDFSDAFSNHLKAADIPPRREFAMTIATAEVVPFAKFGAGPNEPKQPKLVVGFRETGKTLVANATNARTLADAFGATTESLLGKRIILSQYSTNMGPAIKVTVPAQPAQVRAGDPFAHAAPPPAAAPSAPQQLPPIDQTTMGGGDFDDDIPF